MRSVQLLQNRFFDPITPSIRNIEPNAKSKMAAKWPMGSGEGVNLRLLGTPNDFHEMEFLIRIITV